MNKIIAILFLFVSSVSLAQTDSMSLEQLVAEVLLNNYDIAIALNNQEVAQNNASKGQAGYYPSIGLNANGNYSNNNTNLSFAGGLPPVEVNGAQNTGVGANIGVNYLIFNGFGRMHAYNGLIKRKQLNEIQSQVVSENLVLDIVNKYLDVQQAYLNERVASDNLKISEDRLKRTQIANENGVKSKLDLWSAQVDLTNDSLSLLTIRANLQKQSAYLNTLIGRNASEKLKIANDIPVPQIEDLEKAKNKALSNNASILLSQVSLELAKENSEIVNAQQWPQVNLNASYGINSSQNGAGIILSQKTLGLNSGISFSMPIFNGNQLTTAIKNADLATENGQLELKKAIQNIDYQFEAAKVDLQLLQDNISALEKSIALANLALERATISYNEGIISYNDLRVAQLNLLAAKSKRNEATIAMVRLFYSINRLSGDLIQK